MVVKVVDSKILAISYTIPNRGLGFLNFRTSFSFNPLFRDGRAGRLNWRGTGGVFGAACIGRDGTGRLEENDV